MVSKNLHSRLKLALVQFLNLANAVHGHKREVCVSNSVVVYADATSPLVEVIEQGKYDDVE